MNLCTIAANEHYKRFWRPQFPGEQATKSTEYVTDDISVVCVDLYRDENAEPLAQRRKKSWHQKGRLGLRRLFMSEENLFRLGSPSKGGVTPP